jgi:uncharacterized protein (TIRG00374 family)
VRTLIDSVLGRQLIGLAVLLLAVVVLALRVDLSEAIDALDDASAGWAILGLALFGLSKLVHAVRWQIMMRPFARPSPPETIKIFLLGNLVNGLLPLRAGDLARVQIGSRRLGVARAQMVSSVFVVETLLDALAFVALLCCAVALGGVPGLTSGVFLSLAAISVAACVAAALLSVRAGQIGAWLADRPVPGAARVARAVTGLLDGLRPFSDMRAFLPALALSMAGWTIEAGAYAAVGEAFALELEALDYLVVMIAANLLTALPLTPLGFGIYELGLQELVAALGPTPEQALAYVLGAHLLFSAWIVGAGATAAWTLSLRADEIFYLRGNERPDPMDALSAAGRRRQTQ